MRFHDACTLIARSGRCRRSLERDGDRDRALGRREQPGMPGREAGVDEPAFELLRRERRRGRPSDTLQELLDRNPVRGPPCEPLSRRRLRTNAGPRGDQVSAAARSTDVGARSRRRRSRRRSPPPPRCTRASAGSARHRRQQELRPLERRLGGPEGSGGNRAARRALVRPGAGVLVRAAGCRGGPAGPCLRARRSPRAARSSARGRGRGRRCLRV